VESVESRVTEKRFLCGRLRGEVGGRVAREDLVSMRRRGRGRTSEFGLAHVKLV
jgi:hypothetical protein